MRRLTGIRVARSCLTPQNAVVDAELDFQLGPNMGIKLVQAYGYVTLISDVVPDAAGGTSKHGIQSLHLETDAMEDMPVDDGEDEVNADTEACFAQGLTVLFHEDDTNGNAAAAVLLSPNAPVPFPDDLVSARNITHRAETTDADLLVAFHLMLYYYYVELTNAEMGLFLARRL